LKLETMKKKLKMAGLILLGLFGVAFAVAMIYPGPRMIWGMLRYDQRREGDLKVGQQAPGVTLTALDGKTKVKLLEEAGGKPLVLIFGSFT
jgi:hypothetical protein